VGPEFLCNENDIFSFISGNKTKTFFSHHHKDREAMSFFSRFLFLFSLLLATVSQAEELHVQVFYDGAPLKGVEVRVDEDSLGATDTRGLISGEVQPGSRKVHLVDDQFALPIDVNIVAGSEGELSVNFTSVEGDSPDISFESFTEADPGATGFLVGRVTDSSGSPLAGARVATLGRVSVVDSDGIFSLEVPRGLYDVRTSAPGYETAIVKAVRVLAGSGVTLGLALDEVAEETSGEVETPQLTLEEVVVTGVFKVEDSADDVKRYATTIVNAIDVEMLERFGDGDVASALQRVSGVSVQDDKYATVRGLDGRYISATLNGLLLPSTDPQRRDVQLDLFPTNILGGIEISKAFTADQLATTSGGSIKIRTKGLPQEFTFEVSAGVGATSGVTGSDVLSHKGSSTDYLGYDSGLRELVGFVLDQTEGGRDLLVCDPGISEDICTDRIVAAGVAVAMEDDYNVKSWSAIPGASLGVSIGDKRPLDTGAEWGYYVAANYGYGNGDRGLAVLSNPIGDEGSYQRTNETIDASLYAVTGIEWGIADEFLSKTTVIRSTDIQTRQDRFTDNAEEVDRFKTILQFVERQFASQSFSGHHEFDFGGDEAHILDWNVGLAQTLRDEPDRRQYTYFNEFLSLSAFERRWSELTEDTIDFSLDYSIPVNWSAAASTQFSAGVLSSEKERDVELYRFSLRPGSRFSQIDGLSLSSGADLEADVLSYGNFAIDAFRIAPTTTSTDSYTSDEKTEAYYLNTQTEIGESLTFVVGARYEEFTQDLAYPNSLVSTSELTTDGWYPSANITYRLGDDWQVRAAYSETVSYPGLIERSESLSFDPLTDDPIFGNPNLVSSTVNNFDIRVEYYLSPEESVSLAVFSKEIDNPIERALPDASGSATTGITFRNQVSVDLEGIELEFSKDVIDNASWYAFLSGNVSYIDSSVSLGADSLRLEGADAQGRALQGQSEYLANVQFGLDHYPSEQKLTLLLNYFDDRIFRIARGAATGPEIESGRYLLDLTYEKRFGNATPLEVVVKNILNDEIEWVQNSNVIESFQVGTSFNVKLNYEFL